jgi:Putative polyhydroxyalkanoic acid system protein (PHA_gran_rgn)
MIGAGEPLVVTIAHRLGREEAKRRIAGGLDAIRAEVARYVTTLDYSWTDDRLDFRAVLLLQTITGRLEVDDDFVRIEFGLPRLLHLVAGTIAGRIEQRGHALLDPPKD